MATGGEVKAATLSELETHFADVNPGGLNE